METNFNFKSQVCTSREQSEGLLALGLKKETADMHWFYTGKIHGWQHCSSETYIEAISHPFKKEWATNGVILPAWSLHRLWELLPKSIWHDNGLEKKYHPIIEYGFVNYVAECGMELFDFDCGYEVWGSMIVVIEWLIKEGYFNKEFYARNKV